MFTFLFLDIARLHEAFGKLRGAFGGLRGEWGYLKTPLGGGSVRLASLGGTLLLLGLFAGKRHGDGGSRREGVVRCIGARAAQRQAMRGKLYMLRESRRGGLYQNPSRYWLDPSTMVGGALRSYERGNSGFLICWLNAAPGGLDTRGYEK